MSPIDTKNIPLPCACIDEAPASVWWRIGGGAFLAMNGMVFSIALNGSEVTAEERYALELTVLLVALPVFALLSKEFVEATWRALSRRQLSIELLFLIGIVASLAASAVYFIRGQGNGYADIAAMLLVVYALGRQIGAYGKQRVLRSLEAWAPERRMVRLLSGDTVPATDVRPGDRIRVLPGEIVPVDCRVLYGRAFLHEASLTGESLAAAKQPGDLVAAGSFPLDASLDAEVVTTGGSNQIDAIRASIESGLARPGTEQRLAMKALRWFVPLVLATATATFLWHWRILPWDRAIFPALAVAVVACPCALGFATPLAVWTAMARLRELGIITRSGEAMERLAEIDTVVFDKTGTLTLPEEYAVTWDVAPAWHGREAKLRWLLREAELASAHPLARTLIPLWADAPVDAGPALRGVRLLPGVGIEAEFENGQTLWAGRGEGRQLKVQVDGAQAATIDLIEQQAAGVSPSVKALEALGLQVVLATGDTAERAGAVPIANRRVRQTPAEKHAYLEALHHQGRKALFAGDGLNDAGAMAWSHVACAAPHSAELVTDLSELVFLHRDWSQLARAIALARKTRQVVRWNITFSLAYNLAGMAAAAFGWLHPVACALLMTASSLTVILYTMHLMDWEEPTEAPCSQP